MKNPSSSPDQPPALSFVDNKTFSFDALAEALQPAIAANHHTNFGPVSLQLSDLLWRLNGANPLRAACCTCNGTLALQVAVAAFENHFGRPLRWAVSDFGFMTSFIGPFESHVPVPCRDDGFISVDALAALDPAAYDAVLATNVFGLHEDFDALFDFCRTHGKALLIDNAAGFRALERYHAAAPADESLLWAEVISLHYTKPWGMGEGGAVFLPADMLALCRSALNFGVGDGKFLPRLAQCTNGKMSEIAAAQILLRVRDHSSWAPLYRQQAERIFRLGKDAGLMPLVEVLPSAVVAGQIAFVSARPLPMDELQASGLPLLKYYRPGPGSGATARRLYDHVVNVPCHAGMAAVTDHRLATIFATLARER